MQFPDNSWDWTVLKKHFPQIKKFENGLGKKYPDLKFFPLILAENPLYFPDFPDWKKSSKFSFNFPDRWEPCREMSGNFEPTQMLQLIIVIDL